MRLSLILAGICLACCLSAAADTGTGSFDDGSDGIPLVAPGGFYTAGKYIYNAKGEKHLFRGVSRPGYGDKLNGDFLMHENEFPKMSFRKWPSGESTSCGSP